MSSLIAFVIGVLSITLTAKAAVRKQVGTAQRQCHCVCRPIGVDVYQWALDDLRAAIDEGERVKAYNWMTGPIVCVRPDEPNVDGRFLQLQAIVDAGYHQRCLDYPWCNLDLKVAR